MDQEIKRLRSERSKRIKAYQQEVRYALICIWLLCGSVIATLLVAGDLWAAFKFFALSIGLTLFFLYASRRCRP